MPIPDFLSGRKPNKTLSVVYIINYMYFIYTEIERTQRKIYRQMVNQKLIAFEVRRMQHRILGFLWYSIAIPVVFKGDLLWYSFCHTSAFSAPS